MLGKRKLNKINKISRLNEVYAIDEIGPGGANHIFSIVSGDKNVDFEQKIIFQKGPRNDSKSTQGVLSEDLLEIVRDVLSSFQKGAFSCHENEMALMHIEEALLWLNKRVEDRWERKVLGTYNK